MHRYLGGHARQPNTHLRGCQSFRTPEATTPRECWESKQRHVLRGNWTPGDQMFSVKVTAKQPISALQAGLCSFATCVPIFSAFSVRPEETMLIMMDSQVTEQAELWKVEALGPIALQVAGFELRVSHVRFWIQLWWQAAWGFLQAVQTTQRFLWNKDFFIGGVILEPLWVLEWNPAQLGRQPETQLLPPTIRPQWHCVQWFQCSCTHFFFSSQDEKKFSLGKFRR